MSEAQFIVVWDCESAWETGYCFFKTKKAVEKYINDGDRKDYSFQIFFGIPLAIDSSGKKKKVIDHEKP